MPHCSRYLDFVALARMLNFSCVLMNAVYAREDAKVCVYDQNSVLFNTCWLFCDS